MKNILTLFIISFSLLPITSCKKKSPEYFHKIPLEDRFIFNIGETLDYKCSNGLKTKVIVKNYIFSTQTKTSTDWFNNTQVDHTDIQNITLEALTNDWNIAIKNTFGSSGFDLDSPCFIIFSDAFCENGNPFTTVALGCQIVGSPIISLGCSKFQEIIINNKTYKKIYFDSRENGNNSFTIYWNMKFGILSFETNNSKWDLETDH